ncbi:hypothetical protein MFIFM68171_02103 [Madurella fahalii]|uniref:Uncharacterized protein n=1 Tax=Madurella fahalii TaxID=1157608 RepID=A0ABQ0G2A6_9PEZI
MGFPFRFDLAVQDLVLADTTDKVGDEELGDRDFGCVINQLSCDSDGNGWQEPAARSRIEAFIDLQAMNSVFRLAGVLLSGSWLLAAAIVQDTTVVEFHQTPGPAITLDLVEVSRSLPLSSNGLILEGEAFRI